LGLGRAWRVFYPHEQFSSRTAFSDESGRGTKWLSTVHVSWLDILLYFGWGGTLLYFFIWFRIGKAIRERISALPPGEARTLGQALFCGLVSLFPGLTAQLHLVILSGAFLGTTAALLSLGDVISARERSAGFPLPVGAFPSTINPKLLLPGGSLPRRLVGLRSTSRVIRPRGRE